MSLLKTAPVAGIQCLAKSIPDTTETDDQKKLRPAAFTPVGAALGDNYSCSYPDKYFTGSTGGTNPPATCNIL